MTIDIVDFPINSMVYHSTEMFNYQSVSPIDMEHRLFFWKGQLAVDLRFSWNVDFVFNLFLEMSTCCFE